jgi:hypothetical protein
MSAQIVYVRVHEPEAVREIVKEAMEIADGVALGQHFWATVFEQSCVMLAARVTLMPQPSMPMGALDLNALRNGR